MSLPSYAHFVDDNGFRTGHCFVNVGWFVTPEAMYRELAEVCKSKAFENKDWAYINMYDYKFTRAFIIDCTGHTKETVTKCVKAEMERQAKAQRKEEKGFGL